MYDAQAVNEWPATRGTQYAAQAVNEWQATRGALYDAHDVNEWPASRHAQRLIKHLMRVAGIQVGHSMPHTPGMRMRIAPHR